MNKLIFVLIGLIALYPVVFIMDYSHAQDNNDCYDPTIWFYYQTEYAFNCIEERLDNLEDNQKTISDTSRITINEISKMELPITISECEDRGYMLFYDELDFKPYCYLDNGRMIQLLESDSK